MSNKDNLPHEELIKSLTEELELSEEQVEVLLKSGDYDEKDKGGDDDDEKKSKKDDKGDDTKKASKDDLMKSLKDTLNQLQALEPEKKIEKSNTDDLEKSIGDKVEKSLNDFKDGLEKSYKDKNEELVTLVKGLKDTIDTIGENSQGIKGQQRFDYIQKSGDDDIVKEGNKTYIPYNKQVVANTMLGIIEKSEDEDLKKSFTPHLMNLQGSGELTPDGVKLLNQEGFFLKSQKDS